MFAINKCLQNEHILLSVLIYMMHIWLYLTSHIEVPEFRFQKKVQIVVDNAKKH